MRFKFGVGLVAICAVAFALPAWAHHSHGNYVDTFMDLEGVVKEVHWSSRIPGSTWKSRTPKASRKCGLWKQPVALGSKRLGSRATTSKRATPSKRGAIVSGTAPTAACSGF